MRREGGGGGEIRGRRTLYLLRDGDSIPGSIKLPSSSYGDRRIAGVYGGFGAHSVAVSQLPCDGVCIWYTGTFFPCFLSFLFFWRLSPGSGVASISAGGCPSCARPEANKETRRVEKEKKGQAAGAGGRRGARRRRSYAEKEKKAEGALGQVEKVVAEAWTGASKRYNISIAYACSAQETRRAEEMATEYSARRTDCRHPRSTAEGGPSYQP